MKKQKDIDGVLVKQIQSGKKDALALLVKRWHKTFCEKAFWLVKDADVAKDIAQDAWSVIINKIDGLKKPESFGSWALRIVYTKSLDWIKANKKLKNNLDDYNFKNTVITEDENSNTAIKLRLLKALKTLPPHQQMVIRLFYTQEYSLKEISVMLNISVGTAKSRLFHARERLKQLLKT
ncbi:RNA polymerase sigma factor [Algibacter mikhailovii]|uniref:DNA-directed RNA polymerase sigma-70 factor n=1 Tax=Algibacter mikhailovii TaxID=425498 RepID=A0A918VCK3_9FLAO|nr:sigma-70 family RNA polymerase sigma factor [Algibacter mikhailovii]GGZ86791.1 DNA-directed RNA polymerase sigma-70 factor [Algibacter mikhailovii]